MIHLVRLDEPLVLALKKDQWLAKFLASGNPRPNSRTYNHPEILQQLTSISHNKCYYCEQALKKTPKEIDHYIELICDRNLAFNWTNLYLSCDNCNRKIRHTVISVHDCLNPFLHSNEEIENHITFDNEIIRIKNNSKVGDDTIKKFKLGSEQLDYIRLKYINNFLEEFDLIKDKARDNNRTLSPEEKESLLRYSYPDHPFSMMFKIILKKKGLL